MQQEHHAGDKAQAAEAQHEDQESGRAERAMRREHGRKDFRVVATAAVAVIVAVHGAHYTGKAWPKTMARKKPREETREEPSRQRLNAPPARATAARLKPGKAQRKADAEAAHGELPQWTKAEIEEAFRRFRRQSDAARRAASHQSVHPAGRGGAVGAGDRCRRQQGDAGSVRARRHAGEDGRARRGAGARPDQDHRALPHQGEERHRAVGAACRRAWRRGAARPRGARSAARRRPQDRQCGAQHRLRRADHRGRHPHLPRRQPHRAWPSARRRSRSR